MNDAQLPDAAAILAALHRGGQARADVHAFSTLGSTSAWLRAEREALIAQLEKGRAQLCVTDWQQAGEGRRGKTFQTLPGNLTFSVLSRLPVSANNLLGLSLVTGIAVAQALEGVLGIEVMLKWPNDVILNERKLGGLLTELVTVAADGSGAVHTDVITGIGINVHHDEAVASLGMGATSLKQVQLDVSQAVRDALVGDIGVAVLSAHERFVAEGWSAFASAWKVRDWLDGKAVFVHKEHSKEQVRARGVNAEGALIVESAGKLLPLYGGNVSIRPTL